MKLFFFAEFEAGVYAASLDGACGNPVFVQSSLEVQNAEIQVQNCGRRETVTNPPDISMTDELQALQVSFLSEA